MSPARSGDSCHSAPTHPAVPWHCLKEPLGALSIVCLPTPPEVPRVLQGMPPAVGGLHWVPVTKPTPHSVLGSHFPSPCVSTNTCLVGWGLAVSPDAPDSEKRTWKSKMPKGTGTNLQARPRWGKGLVGQIYATGQPREVAGLGWRKPLR